MRINVDIYKGRWVDLNEDVSFLLVPMSHSTVITKRSEDYILDLICSAIKDWKGITDMEDKPLKCTLENKKILLDQSIEIYNFINVEISKIHEELDTQKKS